MKTLEELRRELPPTDLQEVVRNIEDDMYNAKPGDKMYDTILEIVAKYYPPNPLNRIFGTPKRRNEIGENTEGV
jgi:hypothetical protein